MADVQAWQATQAALAVEVGRVSTLLRSLNSENRQPFGVPESFQLAAAGGVDGDPVLGRWGLAEVAMHLSQTWVAIPGLARSDLEEVEAIVPGRGAGDAVARNVDQLGAVTLAAVASDPERNLGVLADRIETRAHDYLACCAAGDPDFERPWLLSGITVPPHLFTAHLLSETVVHGSDIARAAGRPWRIEPAHAALIVRWFLLELLLHGAPALIGDPATLDAVRGRYRFDIRGHGVVRMVFDERGARLDADPGRPDCRMSFDPVAFLLMFFGRRGPMATAARGGLLAWGRKPWLAMRLQKALPTP